MVDAWKKLGSPDTDLSNSAAQVEGRAQITATAQLNLSEITNKSPRLPSLAA